MNTIIKIIVLVQWKMFLCEGCQHTKNNPEMKKQKVNVLKNHLNFKNKSYQKSYE